MHKKRPHTHPEEASKPHKRRRPRFSIEKKSNDK